MNIIHFTGMRSNKYGGLEKFFVELSFQLLKDNDKLILVYEECPTNNEYINDLVSNNVKIEVLNTRNSSVVKSLKGVATLLKKYKPSIIHTHFAPASYIVLFIAAILRYPIRLKTIHGMLSDTNSKDIVTKKELSIKTRLLMRLMYLLSTEIYCVSDGIKLQFQNIFGVSRKIKTIYIGVEYKEFNKELLKIKHGFLTKKSIITCVAFHDKVKGIDVLLRALSLLKKRNKDISFNLLQIGSGKEENTDELKDLAVQLELDECIIWMGLRNDVDELLTISDIYCQPSRSEGISLALMEASILGIPMVATNTGGIPEIVINNETGLLVDVEDFIAMSFAIENILKNTSLRKQLSEKARIKASSQFQLKIQVEVLIEQYKKRIRVL